MLSRRVGFEILGYYGESAVFAKVGRGGVGFHFRKADSGTWRTNLELRKISSDVYDWETDIESLSQG